MDKKQRRANDLDPRLVDDYFGFRDRGELTATCEVGVTRNLPMLHASLNALEELEKKRRFVIRQNTCHHKHLLPGVFVLLGKANALIGIATGGTQTIQGRCFRMVRNTVKRIFALLLIVSLALTGGVSQSLGADSPELYPVVETWQ